MTLSKDPAFLRNIIIDHYDAPNKKVKEQPKDYIKLQNKSATCIDDITIYIKYHNDIIDDVVFSGIGCAISTSSTDIMAEMLVNKNFIEAFKIIDNYLAMISGNAYEEENLDELIAFYKINEQPNRIKCSQIGILAIYNCLKDIIAKNEIQ